MTSTSKAGSLHSVKRYGPVAIRLHWATFVLVVAVFRPTEDIHGYLAYAIFALAAMHAAAALWHHFYRRDDVLRRMLPACEE